MDNAHPFLKWAGGKSALLPEIRKRYPQGLGTAIDCYVEPFLGSGAVLFDILKTASMAVICVNDQNRQLVNLYTVLRDHPDPAIRLLYDWQDKYLLMDSLHRQEFYYEKRREYNHFIQSGQDPEQGAALFVFLNRTCFNGIYRVNRSGEFNVPIGSYKQPCICDEPNLRAASDALQKVTILEGDYRQTEPYINDKSFVYMDPPYRPLNTTSSFTSYTEYPFTDEDQRLLAEWYRSMDKKNARLLLSNSNPKNTDPNDTFFDDLYHGFTIETIMAPRSISGKTNGRKSVSELLIRNY